MFTAVYLCYSPTSQFWLAPFTRPQLQLQLNKTSNRDTRPFLSLLLTLSFEKWSLTRRKTRSSLWLSSSQIVLPIYSQFLSLSTYSHLFIYPIQHCGGSVHPFIYPPTRNSYSCEEATLRVLLLLSLPLSLFLQKNCAFLCHGGL